jgi:hypothetical protein
LSPKVVEKITVSEETMFRGRRYNVAQYSIPHLNSFIPALVSAETNLKNDEFEEKKYLNRHKI